MRCFDRLLTISSARSDESTREPGRCMEFSCQDGTIRQHLPLTRVLQSSCLRPRLAYSGIPLKENSEKLQPDLFIFVAVLAAGFTGRKSRAVATTRITARFGHAGSGSEQLAGRGYWQ